MNVPDGGDDHHDATGPNGLSVEFSIQPQVPGDAGNNATIDEAVFKMLTLQVTGDAASVSTPNEIDLAWRQDTMPDPVTFASAPSGVYSKLSMRIDGQLTDNSYWINGHVIVNGTTYPFKIYDRDYLTVALYPDTQLQPGGSARIGVQVQVDHALDSIDWTKVSNDDGTLTLDTFDSYMPTFRQKLVEAFALVSVN
ncbi:MAG: hypothetical protein ACM31C_06200 [Acidobacteriota bacterium]